MMRLTGRRAVGEVDSGYAWLRLLAGVLTSTIGGVGMCSIAVVLPTLQADFGDGVRPGFLRKGDRDDQQTVPFGRRDPSLAILGAVTARAMLHDDDWLPHGDPSGTAALRGENFATIANWPVSTPTLRPN